MSYEALKRAVEAAGGQAALARAIGIAQPSVWHWLHKSRRVPGEYVLAVERVTRVSKHDLRPDLYPRGRGRRPRRADRVAVCSVPACNRRADDPAAQCCAVRECPFAVKEAA